MFPFSQMYRYRPGVTTILTLLLTSLLSGPGLNVVNAGETNVMIGMTAAHNRIRKQLGIAPLRWSDTLAKYARNRAIQLARNNCRMSHISDGKYGENLYWASSLQWSNGKKEVQAITARHVAEAWGQEAADYDHRTNSCRAFAVCGHYTQMIWRDSKEIGCGMAVCADKGQIWVCDYYPPGNFIGQSPY